MNNKLGELTNKFGKKLKMERKKRNLSQFALAELSDLNKNSIGVIERAENSPTLETIEKLANALNMPVTELIDVSKVDL
ncbi:MAG: helix-turn-helix transcriptional regulator [Candidatus Gastranaerophilaceae bacterium]|jgi:putative transcriptional regulator, XRE family|uniref:Helix-turn-helix transcriptional regulator n=1 Tax=Candidatus Limenecus avicola TaxID=2840847 RepID=A0A9D1N1R3_9CLOT|nr:helix-turn-helix transcriptional regulator [Clostridium sp.]HIU93480.1 helix-turn-helix transcriptional regulator [Candidatus Limenecus avicola]